MDAFQPQPLPCFVGLPAGPMALRAIVMGLHQKLGQRDARIVELQEQFGIGIAHLDACIVQRDTRITELERKQQELELDKIRLAHQLELYKKRYYGPRADTAEVGQLLLEFACELEKRPVALEVLEVAVAVQPRRINRGRRNLRLFENLPKVTHVHDLTEEQKQQMTGMGNLVELSAEITWQAEYMPGYFYRIEHVQKKYAVIPADQQKADEATQIVLADKPQQPIDKGMAGPGLLAYVVTSKYGDYLPLYRLQNIFERNGMEIDRSTLCLWCGDVADLIKPVYQLMKERVLCGHVVATDDTVMPLLAPVKTKQARIWIYRGDEDHRYNVFDFTVSRGRDGPNEFLGDYNGVLLGDAYGGYEGICIEKQITKAGCWAHARRKFVDCQKLEPAVCNEALALIGRLFAVDRLAKETNQNAAGRLGLRREKSLAVIDELAGKLQAWKLRLLPRHPVAGAVGYVLNQWAPLRVFLEDGAVALDNNLAEQEMKRIALLRKNALFVGSERGGATAAILSSITSTCRRLGINPQLYLTQLLVNLPSLPMSQVEQWLPDAWQKRTQADDLPSQATPMPPADVVR